MIVGNPLETNIELLNNKFIDVVLGWFTIKKKLKRQNQQHLSILIHNLHKTLISNAIIRVRERKEIPGIWCQIVIFWPYEKRGLKNSCTSNSFWLPIKKGCQLIFATRYIMVRLGLRHIDDNEKIRWNNKTFLYIVKINIQRYWLIL